jgi:hypothetical protein
VNFTRVVGDQPGGAIVDLGAPGTFDSYLAYRPFVLKDGATWRMWYNGSVQPFRCPQNANDRRVGYATSTDGLHWDKHYDGAGPDGSVLPLGDPGSFDAQQVGYVWVVKNGADYWMYYSAADAFANWRVGLAVSHDGKTWEKRRGKTPSGAVLDLGPGGTLDTSCAYQPSVVKERDGLWRMWYRACAAPAPTFGGPGFGTIGYAESDDGIAWVKIPQPGPGGSALAQGPAGAFDSGGLTTPSVIEGSSEWTMYYAGFDGTGTYRIGLARAPR